MKPSNRGRLAALSVALCALIISSAIDRAAVDARLRGAQKTTGRSSAAVAATPDGMRLPGVMVWAWERPEDLRFIDPRKMGVAFLAQTIELRSVAAGNSETETGSIQLRPRLQPLRVPEGTSLMAVVRIESSNDLWRRQSKKERNSSPVPATHLYTDAQRERVADLAAEAAQLSGVEALQIDFDAAQGERPFYAALLKDLRRRLPAGMPLSVTALASWCIGDPWLETLPPGTINEAVPMLFRMGPDGANVASYLKSGKEFRSRSCRASLGLSTDESFSKALLSGKVQRVPAGWNSKRIYIFSPHAWIEQDTRSVTEEVKKWHYE